MPPRVMMTMSAVVLAVLGVLTLFFPEELVTALQLGAAVQLPVQLLAGGFFGIAVLDWTGRGAIYGGIYGRPIVLANFGFRIPTARPLVSSSTLGSARGGPSKRQLSPSPPRGRTTEGTAMSRGLKEDQDVEVVSRGVPAPPYGASLVAFTRTVSMICSKSSRGSAPENGV